MEFPKDVKFIFYADDGIIYSNNKAEMYQFIERAFFIIDPYRNDLFSAYGINLSFEKSSWVKVDGEWKHSLKFLGLRFVPDESVGIGYLVAATRKGSTLRFDKLELLDYEHFRNLVTGGPEYLEAKLEILRGYRQTDQTR